MATAWKEKGEQMELPFPAFSMRLPVGDALRLFWEHHWSRTVKAGNTKKTFKRLAVFFGGKHVDEVGRADIERMRDWMAQQGLKPNSVNTAHTIVTALFYKLSEWKDERPPVVDIRAIQLPARNPGSQVRKVNERIFARKVAWPKSVVYRLIDAAHRMGSMDMADIIEMLYLTRLRPGDLWRMTAENADLARGVLTGIQHKTVTRRLPSGVPYQIALSMRMCSILRRRIGMVALGAPLFREAGYTDGAWLVCVSKRFNLIRRAAGAPHVQLRDFRASSATLLLDNHVDPETVAESLGHTSLRNLPFYTPRKMVHQRFAQEVLEREDTEILI